MAGMTGTMAYASALSAVSIALLLGLAWVWLRNYRTFGSTLTLGLLAFAVVLLVENAIAIYFFFSMGMLYAGSEAAQTTVLLMRGLQVLALGFLTYVTMK